MSALSQVDFSPIPCGILSALSALRSQSPDIVILHYKMVSCTYERLVGLGLSLVFCQTSPVQLYLKKGRLRPNPEPQLAIVETTHHHSVLRSYVLEYQLKSVGTCGRRHPAMAPSLRMGRIMPSIVPRTYPEDLDPMRTMTSSSGFTVRKVTFLELGGDGP